MLIIGHRGAAGLAAENTIRSFQIAQESGAQMLETDLRIKNGEIVLSHDKPQKGVKYATLKELLDIAKLPLNLEFKESGFEKEVLSQIKGFAYKVVITSWSPWVLKKIRTLDGNIRLGLVFGSKFVYLLPIIIWYLKKTSIFWVTIRHSLVNELIMSWFKKAGWEAYAYTVNDLTEVKRLESLQVSGIFTDYPNIFVKEPNNKL